jgi:hypothetical protein
MGKLMSEHAASVIDPSYLLTGTEDDVIPEGKGACVQGTRQRGGLLVGMKSDVAEIMPEPRLKIGSLGGGQGLATSQGRTHPLVGDRALEDGESWRAPAWRLAGRLWRPGWSMPMRLRRLPEPLALHDLSSLACP